MAKLNLPVFEILPYFHSLMQKYVFSIQMRSSLTKARQTIKTFLWGKFGEFKIKFY